MMKFPARRKGGEDRSHLPMGEEETKQFSRTLRHISNSIYLLSMLYFLYIHPFFL